MVTNAHVVKRTGHGEPYHEPKLHASIVRACRAVRALQGEAVFVADRVAGAVTAWIDGKDEVTSRDLHGRVHESLLTLHPAAAYAYDIHDQTL